MKLIAFVFFFMIAATQSRAQVSSPDAIKLAIKYLNGEGDADDLQGEAMGTSAAGSQVWAINPEALCPGCRGQVLLTANNVKIVKIVKEFPSAWAAEADVSEMIKVVRAIYPSISKQTMPNNPNAETNLISETAYADGTNGLFVALWSIVKQPDASADKQFMITLSLSK